MSTIHHEPPNSFCLTGFPLGACKDFARLLIAFMLATFWVSVHDPSEPRKRPFGTAYVLRIGRQLIMRADNFTGRSDHKAGPLAQELVRAHWKVG
jgi:hypothetical protein